MPSACKRRATVAPIRRAAPVTSAVLPSSFPVFCMSGSRMGVGLIKPETDMRISQPLAELSRPSADALAHSARLKERICAEMAAAGGSLGFERYMELALYAPGLGYYSAGARKFGAAGDFITAPELSPLFARCLAVQCAALLQVLGGGDILELGAGSGAMAADMLAELETRG